MKDRKYWVLAGLIATSISGTAFPDAEEIAFRLHNHLVVVKGSIGRLEKLNFVIDTGASCTTVCPRIKRALGLKNRVIETGEVNSLGRSVKVQKAELPSLRIGSLHFQAVSVRVAKLPSVANLRVDGLIGLDLIRRTNLSIDYQSRKLTFGSSERFAHFTGFYPNLAFVPVKARLDGRLLTLVVDTGCGDLILFQRENRNWTGARRIQGKKVLGHAGGKARLGNVLLSDLTIAETKWDQLRAHLMETPTGAYPGIDGVLGVRSLGLKRIQFDFQNGIISWQR